MSVAPASQHDPVTAAALALAAEGFRVLPILPAQKRPPMRAWQDAATTDRDAIVAWWGGLYRGHGVGIATGRLDNGAGFFVLDVDDRPEVSGSDALAELERRHGALPDTITSITGSGSGHQFYLVPDGWPTPRNDQSSKLAVGIDVRGDGGQVVVAPTVHPNGRSYVWEVDKAPGEIEMAVAPLWLMRLLAPVERSAPVERQRGPVVHDPFTLATSPADRFNSSTSWAELLNRDGWTFSHETHDGVEHWVRPGKDAKEGTSATVGWAGNDALKVFTSSVPWLEADHTYSRFQYEAARSHGGDMRAAARAVVAAEVPERLAVVPVGQPVDVDEAVEVPDGDRWLLDQLTDWPAFWSQDEADADWLMEPVLAVGRSGALFAPGGTGKSLFVLWMALMLATGGPGLDGRAVVRRRVLYLDYEMTASDLLERLSAMGAAVGDDLSWLHYATLPSLPPADAPEGGKAIARLAQLVDAELVIIDTFSRAVEGDENDANTVRSFYRWTGLHLKAEGRAFWRVDHAGKDAEKGQRGTSAKNDDVDVVWRMQIADAGFTLLAKKRRMGWVPEEVPLTQSDEPLMYRTVMQVVPAGTAKVIADLDALGIGAELSARKASQLLRDAGRGAKNDAVRAAMRAVRQRPFRAVDNPGKRAPIGGARPVADESGRGAGRGGARSEKPLVDDGARLGARRGAVDRSTAPRAPLSIEGRGGETAPATYTDEDIW